MRMKLCRDVRRLLASYSNILAYVFKEYDLMRPREMVLKYKACCYFKQMTLSFDSELKLWKYSTEQRPDMFFRSYGDMVSYVNSLNEKSVIMIDDVDLRGAYNPNPNLWDLFWYASLETLDDYCSHMKEGLYIIKSSTGYRQAYLSRTNYNPYVILLQDLVDLDLEPGALDIVQLTCVVDTMLRTRRGTKTRRGTRTHLPFNLPNMYGACESSTHVLLVSASFDKRTKVELKTYRGRTFVVTDMRRFRVENSDPRLYLIPLRVLGLSGKVIFDGSQPSNTFYGGSESFDCHYVCLE